ncbi:MAG: transglycosylase SLT domain-containing protein [Nanoarchaeota archaeon]
MRNAKCLALVIPLIIAIFFISLGGVQAASFSSGLIATSPYTGDSTSALSSSFSNSQCKAGQDFILQVSPTGCIPSVVRSDLLEDQNIPVFCPIVATKINPLIDVDSIGGVSFSGNTPSEVSGVGFLPNRAAILNPGIQINNPVLGSIGYAVIVLNQNKNESSMPDFIEGSLTARLTYDVSNAFGVGQSTFYLPVMSDTDWNENYKRYSFWDGKGYLRAESVGIEGAAISVYSDRDISSGTTTKRVVAKENIPLGGTSGDIGIPGFDYCLGSLNLRLNGVEAPDTTATIEINGNPIDLKAGEKFLDNRCSVKSIEKQGVIERVVLSCNEDDKPNNFNLITSPKIKIEVDGSSKTVSVGDKLDYLSQDNLKSVYVAYIRTSGDTRNEKDLVVSFAAIPGVEADKTKLTDDELSSIARFMNSFPDKGADNIFSLGVNIYKAYASVIETIFRGVVSGENFDDVYLSNAEGEDVFGKNIKVVGFADPVDADLSNLDENARKNYENALKDYQSVLDSFASGKYPPSEQATLGENAFRGMIGLYAGSGQKRTLAETCNKLKSDYKDATIPKECENIAALSSAEPLSKDVLIQGRIYRISLNGIKEPGYKEFGAKVAVTMPDGEIKSYDMKKDSIIYINSEIQYSYDGGILLDLVYFKYKADKWQWSWNKDKWKTIDANLARGVEYDGKKVDDSYINIINRLNGASSGGGVDYLRTLDATDESTRESIQLVDVSEDAIKLKVSLKKEKFVNAVKQFFVSTGVKTLNKNVPENFDSAYLFTIQEIKLEKVAKVSVIPNINYAETTADFPFKIGIEKRSIQLSPEKTKSRINSLNETIARWSNINDKLGRAVEVGNKLCLGVGTYLTMKNFFSNLAGEGLARQKVMRGDGGYFDICKEEIVKTGKSLNACLLAKNPDIEKDVEAYAAAIKAQDKKMKDLQEEILTKQILGENFVDTDEVVKRLVDGEYRNDLETKLKAAGIKIIKIDGKEVSVSEIVKRINPNATYLTQARDLELNVKLLSVGGVVGKVAQGEIEAALGNIWVNSDRDAARKTLSEKYGIPGVSLISTGPTTKLPITSTKTFNDVKAKFTNFAAAGVQDESYIHIVKDYATSVEYLIVMDDNFVVEKTFRIDNGMLVPETEINKLRLQPEFHAKGTYQNPYTAGTEEVKYYESGKYAGLPAIVPFDLQNGWYAAVKPTLPIGGSIKAYDDSGRISSFYLCNIGTNKKVEFYSGIGDDDCVMINPAINAPYDKFPGLTDKEAAQLADTAIRAIADASRQYGAAVSSVRIISPSGASQTIKVGEPSLGIPDIQCQDFMSPVECNLLFNVCDPVVCPRSRCDLGGAYPVNDVVASGIAGSIALCLPNFPEVKVPVCLSGIYAGIEGYLSVLDNYQSCLQNSLETGQQIGICDELHSLYMCDFLWNQIIPIANVAVPQAIGKILGSGGTRGGGEYLGISDAWKGAQDSAQFFAQNYAVQSYEAFKARSTAGVGTSVCKNWVSLRAPDGGSLLDSITKPRVPAQFYGNFDEIPYTSATVPPTSHYKVFYHIYAGGDLPAYYQVYLKSSGQAYFQDTNSRRVIASGFISEKEYATETKDFTAPTGYTELCIVVNNQEECGFKQVTTEFGLNYLTEKYVTDEAKVRDVTSSSECVSGTPNVAALLNPNLQSGVEGVIDPAIYNRGITRICATRDPGSATDPNSGGEGSRWVKVGYCDTPNMGCWLDTQSVKDTVKNENLEKEALAEVTESYLDIIKKENGLLSDSDFAGKVKEIRDESNALEKISLINENFPKVFENNKKGFLTLLRGDAYRSLVVKAFAAIAESAGKKGTGICGDGTVQSLNSDEKNEQCDGTDLNGQTCKSQGFAGGGTLSCTNTCEFEFSGCQGEAVSAKDRIEQVEASAEGRAQAVKDGKNNYPVLKFDNGNIGGDIYFMFSDINREDQWTWSNDLKSFYTYEDISLGGSDISSENRNFMEKLSTKNFIYGLQDLIGRVEANDEGNWYNPGSWFGDASLSTLEGTVEFSPDKIFTFTATGLNEPGYQKYYSYYLYFQYSSVDSRWTWTPYTDSSNFLPVSITAVDLSSNGVMVELVPKEKAIVESLQIKDFLTGAAYFFTIDTPLFSLDLIGGASETDFAGFAEEPIVFEFQDGTLRNNLYYKFSGGWYWSSNARDWVKATFTSGAGQSDRNYEFIKQISGMSLPDGFDLLVQRVLIDEEGGWFSSSALVTDKAKFSSDKVVTVFGQEGNQDLEFMQDTYNGEGEYNGKSMWQFWFSHENRWAWIYDSYALEFMGWSTTFSFDPGTSFELGTRILFGVSPGGVSETGTSEPSSPAVTVGNVVSNQRSSAEVSRIIKLAVEKYSWPSNCAKFYNEVYSAAKKYSVSDPLLLFALMRQESSCNPNAGASVDSSSFGLMQINKIHCGRYGLPANVNDCMEKLNSDAEVNINVGAQILAEGYKSGSLSYSCNAFKSEKQNEPAVNKKYSAWDAALRRYNGVGCAGYRSSGTEIFADHDFVEKIMGFYSQLYEISK